MTFADFKALLEMKRKGDIKLPTSNEELKPLIQESLEYIANNSIPLELVTSDKTADILRPLSDTQFIKRPESPTNDTDEIKIDQQLIYAVAYELLANLTKDLTKSQFFTFKRDEIIGTYQWNNYEYLQEVGL